MIEVAQMATQINPKRQALTNEQCTLASEKINDEFLYWASEDVHEELVRLVADKYTRQYERPSFVMHYDRQLGTYKGSARSVDGFSLYKFFTTHGEQFAVFREHSLAGGFSVDEDHSESFYHCVEENLKDVELRTTINALLIDENDLSTRNIESLAMLESFGMGNEEPLYLLKDVPVMKFYQLSGGKHLEIDIGFSRIKMATLYFQQGQPFDESKDKKYIGIVGTLNVNGFGNQKSVNSIIKDIVQILYHYDEFWYDRETRRAF